MPPAPLTAIILAAGQGGRLKHLAREPKVLLRINGQTLLERHLVALENAGIADIVVVVGYERRRIEDNVGDQFPELAIRYTVNPDPLRNGNAFSLWLGLQQAAAGVLVFDGDVVYAEDILQRFIHTSQASAVLVGQGRVDDIESAKTLVDAAGRVVKIIDKRALTQAEREEFQYLGEAVGILRFNRRTKKALELIAAEFFEKFENLKLDWEHLLNQFFAAHYVACHFDASTHWAEIDTPEDYEAAVKLFADEAPMSRRAHD